MKTDKNGCSTCPIGKEQYEYFESNGKSYIQYDYRDCSGKLFSCVAKTLEDARKRKDNYLDFLKKSDTVVS